MSSRPGTLIVLARVRIQLPPPHSAVEAGRFSGVVDVRADDRAGLLFFLSRQRRSERAAAVYRSVIWLCASSVCLWRAVSVGVGVGAAKQGREGKHARVAPFRSLRLAHVLAGLCSVCTVVMVTRVPAPPSVVHGVMRILQGMMAGTKPASEGRL